MKKTRLNKKSKVPITVLKRKLWAIFSLYIRTRDNYTCFTCGRIGYGAGIHAGHFIAKSIGGNDLYFHEDNVHAQCYHCNINLGGNQYEYALRLGEAKAKELYAMKGVFTKWTEDDYIKKIIEYSQKYNDIKDTFDLRQRQRDTSQYEDSQDE